MNGILKLESIRKFVKQNKKVTFIFFDTETTGLISKVGSSFLNIAGSGREDEKEFNINQKKKLQNLLKEKNITLNKFDFDNLLKNYNDLSIDSIHQKELSRFYKKNFSIRTKLNEISKEFNIWRTNEILKNGKDEIELTEFAAIKINIEFDGKKYTKSKITKIHKYFKPQKMSDEIRKLTYWNDEKDKMGSEQEADKKYEEIINFFNNKNSINVIVAHNLLGFDLPALTLFLKKFPKQLEKWNNFLHMQTTFALDTKDINVYFKKINKRFPELFSSFEKIPNTNFMRSNQAYLQQLTNVTNKSQHTAIEDVKALLTIIKRLMKLFYYLNQKTFKEIYQKIKESKLQEIKILWSKLSKIEKYIYKGLIITMLNKKFPNEDILLEKKETDVTFKRARSFVKNKTKNPEKRKQFMAVFTAVKNSMLKNGSPIGIAIASGYKKAKESIGLK
jgi:uncharacterized protein YprB with RNaseH-like and TPR domain